MLHHVASGEQVVELVGAADLDVGLDRDGVVGLHQRIEKLRDRDRLVRAEPLREVVPLENPRDGDRARQPDDVGVRQLAEPLTVEADLRTLAVENSKCLLCELLRVRVDHVVRKDGTLVGTARRVSDPRRVVADDEHDDVPSALELGETVEDVRESQMDVGRRCVDPELDAQRAAELQLALELSLRQHVDRVPREVGDCHCAESSEELSRGSRSAPARARRPARTRTAVP